MVSPELCQEELGRKGRYWLAAGAMLAVAAAAAGWELRRREEEKRGRRIWLPGDDEQQPAGQLIRPRMA